MNLHCTNFLYWLADPGWMVMWGCRATWKKIRLSGLCPLAWRFSETPGVVVVLVVVVAVEMMGVHLADHLLLDSWPPSFYFANPSRASKGRPGTGQDLSRQ